MEPHAPVKLGNDAVVILRAERIHLDKANARVGRCAVFYDATKKSFEK